MLDITVSVAHGLTVVGLKGALVRSEGSYLIELIDSPRDVVRSMKRHLNLIARGQLDAPAIQAAYVASQRSDNLKEGLAALREKRSPKFK